MKSQTCPHKNIWFPFTYYKDITDHPPITIKRGKGVYLYDTGGKKYLDAIGSWWVNNLGHNNPEISKAVKKQLGKLEHVLMAGFISDTTVELSDRLSELLPKSLNRIFYSDNGSTAVEVALKIALQYWHYRGEERYEFVSLSGAYHGDTLGAMSVGMIPQYQSFFHDAFKKQHYAHSPYCRRCPVGKRKETCKAECMDSLETILESKQGKIAACIFEPMVQGAAGMRIYPAKVLKKIFRICRKYGVLTIADEVATGLGRTGKLFACEYAGFVPDIMCIAKGLTGGYLPLAATVVKENIFREFRGDHLSGRILHHGHSFTGNPLGSAAACAALEIIKREKIPESLAPKIKHLKNSLEQFRKIDVVDDIRSIGMIGAIELKKETGKNRTAYNIARRAVKHGLLIRPLGNVIYFMPPFVIKEKEIDTMVAITRRAIEETVYG